MRLERYERFLDEAVIPVRLACRTGSGWPVVLSLWYVYREDSLYCATRASAKIVTYLRNDSRCAFEVASDLPPYCGIRGQAEAEVIPQLGGMILEQLVTRYLGGTTSPLAERLLRNRDSEVAIRVRPVSVYAWNFTERMRDSVDGYHGKPCPDDASPS
jgi:nitroimidazol reductase NimA-like FMN-containing flavoprotein (pyridoxamine 5'-phosphate oxidase superfamily)